MRICFRFILWGWSSMLSQISYLNWGWARDPRRQLSNDNVDLASTLCQRVTCWIWDLQRWVLLLRSMRRKSSVNWLSFWIHEAPVTSVYRVSSRAVWVPAPWPINWGPVQGRLQRQGHLPWGPLRLRLRLLRPSLRLDGEGTGERDGRNKSVPNVGTLEIRW